MFVGARDRDAPALARDGNWVDAWRYANARWCAHVCRDGTEDIVFGGQCDSIVGVQTVPRFLDGPFDGRILGRELLPPLAFLPPAEL